MTPSISIRESIRWLPDKATEPTSTLVLTSAEKRFIDVRIINAKGGNRASDNEAGSDVLHTKRLDWAFAGTSSSEIRTHPSGDQVVHSTWRHWVDSRSSKPEDVVDEGDMFPRPDGTTLEVGNMVNPATGRKTDYEEVWRDMEPIPTAATGEAGRKCIVLQIHDEEKKSRGMLIRLGQFCQGIWILGGQVSLERWEWDKAKGWERRIRMGDGWLPCAVVLEGERLTLGGEVKYGEFVWKVVEIGAF